MTKSDYQKLLKFYMYTNALSNQTASAMIKHLKDKYKGVENDTL